jgi:methanogenic corrinoid protein MtbC1
MTIDRDAPLYNLKAVVQETGIRPDTLRAWERRYGLPEPGRTTGGHRLYSQRNIDTLKWLMARQDEGLSISRAVELWRALEAKGRDPLDVHPLSLSVDFPPAAAAVEGSVTGDFRQAWVAACLDFDERQAEAVITQALGLFPPEIVAHEVLQKGLAELGEDWFHGDASVQQEHFASAMATRRVELLLASAPPPTRPERILTGCPADENHAFPVLLITFMLRRHGWDVIYLGASVPTERLGETIRRTAPSLVILSAQRITTAASLRESALVVRQEGAVLGYGGLIFNRVPSLTRHIPGHFLGESLITVPAAVEKLVHAPPPLFPVKHPSPDYAQASADYAENLASIEARVWESLRGHPALEPYYLKIANANLASSISAALSLGDMNLLGADITWITGLLASSQIAPDLLREYLHVYHRAARSALGERGRVITAWLDAVTQ